MPVFNSLGDASFRQACVIAGNRILVVAYRSRTLVAPRRPQPPDTAAKTFGCVAMRLDCCRRVNLIIPHLKSGYPSVANIFPDTRKSGWSWCELSVHSARLKASRRNPSTVTATDPRARMEHQANLLRGSAFAFYIQLSHIGRKKQQKLREPLVGPLQSTIFAIEITLSGAPPRHSRSHCIHDLPGSNRKLRPSALLSPLETVNK
jgi:hypothetical protein